MKPLARFSIAFLILFGIGCGSTSSSNDASSAGGSGGANATGGSTGTGGAVGGHGGGTAGSGGAAGTGGHVCAASTNTSCASCPNSPCCGGACCAYGEWCDASGATPVCRCGSGNGCTGGDMCGAPTVNAENPCGIICCSGGNCPISRRMYKRDVHELTRDELDRIYGDLRQIKLTTYQYKNEPVSSPHRLGFIIDDTKTPYPVNPDGNSVNLYGYVSMAVAAIQAQSEEIAALRAEVARLRQRSTDRPEPGRRAASR